MEVCALKAQRNENRHLLRSLAWKIIRTSSLPACSKHDFATRMGALRSRLNAKLVQSRKVRDRGPRGEGEGESGSATAGLVDWIIAECCEAYLHHRLFLA
mmetsp:Transcript_23331/g.32554  ORF Transcript_23331/g.32554 Transcript_23331/m.32554 type:complete len:100 (+) Transcript_23331:618-917(+)